MRGLPSTQYVSKVFVGTPTRVNVDVQPTCPFCEKEAEIAGKSETAHYCVNHCDTFLKHGEFTPKMQVTATFKIDFENARESQTVPLFSSTVRLNSKRTYTKQATQRSKNLYELDFPGELCF